jgi:hypothetical protein
MVSLLEIIAGVAAVLAVVVTSLVIAVCLVLAQVTAAVRTVRGHPRRVPRGVGGARPAPPPSAGSTLRDASGVYRRGNR